MMEQLSNMIENALEPELGGIMEIAHPLRHAAQQKGRMR